MDSVLAAFAANEDWSHFYVVAPATAAEALRARLAVTSPGAAVAETWRRRGHFSGEELAGYRDAFTRGGSGDCGTPWPSGCTRWRGEYFVLDT